MVPRSKSIKVCKIIKKLFRKFLTHVFANRVKGFPDGEENIGTLSVPLWFEEEKRK